MKIKVLFCASEVSPFAKTGGLAEVAGTLPLALGNIGVECVIMMPKYRGITEERKKLSPNVSIYFVENEEYFNRFSLYGDGRGDFHDNLKRFNYFCNAALLLAQAIPFKPDIIHAHDWQAALLPVLLKTTFAHDRFFEKTKTLLTIHNVAYQGIFSRREYPQLDLPDELYSMQGFEFFGHVNLMKAGIIYADAVSTVSPTYAKEAQTRKYGCGLEGVIATRKDKIRGILNGIDDEEWDPSKDTWIPERFSPGHLRGKAACKTQLQKKFGLAQDPSVAVFGMVTRLAEQKGLDILSEVCDQFLSNPVQMILLGDGEKVYQRTFKNVAARHPKKAAFKIGYSRQDAHEIYAGSDFFLMPSYYEPCGLSQMISMKYGTLPVARYTGGLADTVVDADEDVRAGNGFVFHGPSPEHFLYSLKRALRAFEETERLNTLRARAMAEDFSWARSAEEYRKYYLEILGAPVQVS